MSLQCCVELGRCSGEHYEKIPTTPTFYGAHSDTLYVPTPVAQSLNAQRSQSTETVVVAKECNALASCIGEMLQQEPERIGTGSVCVLQSEWRIGDDPIIGLSEISVVLAIYQFGPEFGCTCREIVVERTLASERFIHDIAIRQRYEINQFDCQSLRCLVEIVCLVSVHLVWTQRNRRARVRGKNW